MDGPISAEPIHLPYLILVRPSHALRGLQPRQSHIEQHQLLVEHPCKKFFPRPLPLQQTPFLRKFPECLLRVIGKKIYAYGDALFTGSYFVASEADRIYLNPAGELSMRGLGSTSLYFKNLLDKLGVTFQVVKVGSFKSAVEPYIMDEMSQPARAQLDTMFNNMWGFIREKISESRKGVTPALIDSLVSLRNITFAPASLAVESGLVDSLLYGREINDRLAQLVGVEKEKLNKVSPSILLGQTPWASSYTSKNQVAVLYACGDIADGNDKQINFEKLVPVIVRLAENENVKGMVLRVNSPGGAYSEATRSVRLSIIS